MEKQDAVGSKTREKGSGTTETPPMQTVIRVSLPGMTERERGRSTTLGVVIKKETLPR